MQHSIKKKRMRQEAAPAPEVQQCRPQLNEGAAKPNPNVGTKRRMTELCQKLAPLMRRVSEVPTELSEREVGGRAKAPPSRQRLGIALNAVTRGRCENVSAQHADQKARRTNRSEKASLYENAKQEVNVPEEAKVAALKRRGPILNGSLQSLHQRTKLTRLSKSITTRSTRGAKATLFGCGAKPGEPEIYAPPSGRALISL